MKLKLSALQCILLSIVIVVFASCAKDGAVGPAGPAGAQGPAGAAGGAGAAGAKGDTGVANVKYSEWLDVTFAPNSDSSVWSATIDAPALDSTILTNGDIKVYWNIGSDSSNSQVVLALPVYEPFLLGVILNSYYSSQLITLIATADISSFADNGNHYFQYRYVLIPGGVKVLRPVKGATTSYGGIDWNDYKQVKKYLKLKD